MSQCVTNIPCNTYRIEIPDVYPAETQNHNKTIQGLLLLKKLKRIYSALHERGLDLYLLIQFVTLFLLMVI